MGKLILKIMVFLALLLIIIMAIPVDERSKFTGLKEDCFYHAIWLHDRIFLNPKPIDVAFVGSSHTINGIDDGMIEHELDSLQLCVANLGYCRYGDNLYYILVKDLLRVKKPKMIFLEVREDEDRYSHPVFPYLADPTDIWMAWPWFNRDILSDDAVSLRYRMQLAGRKLLPPDTLYPERKEDHGFASSADTVPGAVLKEIKIKRSEHKWTMGSLERNFYMAFPRAYIRKIGELCKAYDVKLVFIYLPEYASGLWQPLESSTYSKYGKILIPPREIFESTTCWGDESHLNQAGAKALSAWIAASIKKDTPVVKAGVSQ